MSVTLVDSTGLVSGVGVAMPEANEPSLSNGRSVGVESSSDGSALRVIWYGSACDREANIAVGEVNGTLQVQVVPGPQVECDGIAVRYVAILDMAQPAPSAIEGSLADE